MRVLELTLGMFDVTCFDIARIKSLRKCQDFSVGNKRGVIRDRVYVRVAEECG